MRIQKIAKKLMISMSVVALCIFALHILGCTAVDDPAGKRAVRLNKQKGPIYIAAASPWGESRNMLYEGLALAQDKINTSGGVLGRQIEILYFDDQNDEAAGQICAYRIAENQDICAVIGHSSSSVSVPNALLYHYYGILMFSPLSTGTALTTQGFDKVFRNIPSDDLFGKEAADLCLRMGWRKVIVYYNDGTYGESLANSFEQQCTLLGVEVQDRSGYSDSMHRNDYASAVKFWKRNYTFDAVFLAGIMPAAGRIINEIRSQGITCPIIGGEAFDTTELISVAGKNAENVYAVTMYDQKSVHPSFTEFTDEFRCAYGKDADQAAVQGYDALMLLSTAFTKAKSIVPDRVAAAIKSLDTWDGAAGPYSFDEFGNITGKKVFIKKVSGSKFITIRVSDN